MARPRQISDEQILTAMRSAVLNHGPKVPLEQVASGLGVTAPALLKRFGSRDELVLEALRPPMKPEWVDWLMAGPSNEQFKSQLLDLFGRIVVFLKDVIPCLTALRESGIDPHRVFGKDAAPDTGIRALQHWLDQARELKLIDARETETAAFAIIGALQTRVFFSHVIRTEIFSPAAERRYLDELATMFCRSLGARVSKSRKAS